MTETDIAEDFAEAIEGEFIFVPEVGWHAWDGARWEACSEIEVYGRASGWLQRQYRR